VAVRKAEQEREALARELWGIAQELHEAYPWTPWEEIPEDGPEEVAEDGPKLHAKAQALVAAIVPKDEAYEYERWQVARLVFAAIDAAWTARVGSTTAQQAAP
jgi:hypothetical protein